MKEALIAGGYILLSRKIIESEIFKKPPLYLKVWIYLLSAAQHSQYKNLNRGQLFTSIPEIQEACSHYIGFRKQIPSKDKIFNILQWLRRVCEHSCEHDDEHDTNTTMITTTRATQGILVNVERYSFYQDPQNYKYNDECDNEEATNTTTKKLRTQRDPDNINKNVEECQEEKNDNNVKENIFTEISERNIVTPALRSSDKSVATDIELELELELELEKKKELELELKKKIKKEKSPSPEKKTSFAEFVTLTQTEYDMLLTNLESEQAVKECIAILDNYKGSSGKKYKSDYRAILSWVIDKYKAKKKDSSTTLSKSTQAAEEAIRMLKEREL